MREGPGVARNSLSYPHRHTFEQNLYSFKKELYCNKSKLCLVSCAIEPGGVLIHGDCGECSCLRNDGATLAR
jgi:hypothetical protein